MDHGKDGRLVLDQSRLKLLEAEPFAPGLLDCFDLSPVTTSHISQAKAEITFHGNQNRVARLNGVGKGCFHGGTARSTHGQGHAVIGLPGVTHQFLNLAHQLDVERVQMTDGSSG